MPLNCTVKSRRNTTRDLTKKQGISYHRFPCNPTRLETWRGLLQPREQNIKQRRICSAHFTSKDFVTTKCGKVSVTESQRISNTQSSSAADTELMDVDERERTKMSYNSNAGMRGKCVSAAGIPSNVAVAGGRLVLVLFTLCCVECVRAGGRVGRGGGMSSGGASDAGGAEETEGGQELFTQDGVLLKSCIGRPLSELHTTGALCIVEYPNNTKLIEWRPNDLITIDSEIQDQEWAVVNTVGRRSRTLSGNYTQSDLQARARVIRLPLSELKGFRVTRNNQQIQFTNKQSQWHSTFFFQHGNAEIFIHQLKYHLKTAKSRHDRSMYVVVEPNEDVQKMDRSFAELDIFTENTTDVVWNLVSNFKQRPYATTLEAFSKLTDIVYYGNEATNGKRDVSEDVADLLTKSMSALEDTTTATRQDEYEVISVKPTLPPRPCIPRGTPLTPDQWEGLQDTNGRIDEIDGVKHIIFRGGVAHSIRPIVWKYLLDYYPWRMSHSERIGYQKKKIEEYFSMKLQWRSMTPAQETRFSEYHDRKSLVEKDVNRTDRTNPFYAGDHNPNLVILSDILMTYVMYNFDLGYVQGMSDILSPILALLGNEVDSFWCFVGFMDKIASNFDMDQAGMKNQLLQLNQLLMFTSPELAQHLAQKDSGNMYFCFRWLLVWFKREFSQIDIMRLWEVLWTGLPCVNFHLLICVAILDMEKDVLMGNDCGFTEILKHINDLSMSLDVDTILSKAEGIFHQISAASHLTDQIRITLGMEPQGAAPRDDSDSDAPTSSQRNGTVDQHTENVKGNIFMEPETEEVLYQIGLDMNF